MLFKAPGRTENDKDESHDEKHQGKHESRIVSALSKREEIPEAPARAYKLADNRSGESKADSDLQVSHNPGGHEWQIDLSKYGPAAASQRAHPLDQSAVDLFDAGIDRKEHENGDEHECERNL